MAVIGLNPYRGVATVMTTELNALAASTGKGISAAIDNGTNLDLFADVELNVTFGTAPTANTVIELYIVTTLETTDTNYSDGSTTVLPQGSLMVAGFQVRNVNTAQRMHARSVPLPPGRFKYLVQNTTNQAFPATGSTLRHNPYKMQSV
jgi:hypothetical protein